MDELALPRKVKSVLRTCHTCQTAKHPNQFTYMEMGNIVMHGKNEEYLHMLFVNNLN